MAGRPPNEPRFTLSDIPAAMRREGWPMGARLMERWLSQAAYRMPDAVKRGQAGSTVGNGSFRRFRALTGRGGDFIAYSDVRRSRLPRPVVVTVRA